MRTGGMRGEIKSRRIAAEHIRVLIDPSDGAAHLLDHRKQAAAGLLDIGEVEDDEMRAGAHKRLGEAGIVGGPIGTPRTAVNENIDGGMRSFRPIDVERSEEQTSELQSL